MAGAVFVFFSLLTFSGCDNFNAPLKKEIEYHLSLSLVDSWESLQDTVDAVPAGGSKTIALAASFPVSGPAIEIKDNKTITLSAYSGTKTTAVMKRSGFTGAFFDIVPGSHLILGDGRDNGMLILDGGAVWNEDHSVNSGVTATAPLVNGIGGDVTLNRGAELRNNSRVNTFAIYGGGVYMSGGSFTMTGGSVSGNTAIATNYSPAQSGCGGGVYVQNGSFTMSGGIISGNTASGGGSSMSSEGGGRGGGVYVQNSSTVTMSGGTISGNTVGGDSSFTSGGGVHVESGDFTMSGGTVSGNTVSGSGNNNWGGGICVYTGAFNMSGGTINGNTSNGRGTEGGGVYVNNYSTVIMSGGTISGNAASASGSMTSANGGGVAVGSGGTFTMIGGTISENAASSPTGTSGGGVSAAIFTMSGGAISGNTAAGTDNGFSSQGGGVFAPSFTMSGGTISGNTVSSRASNPGYPNGGGGVGGKYFIMTGGTISGNTATGIPGYIFGGGVQLAVTADEGSFAKTGGTIYGYTPGVSQSNTVTDVDGGVTIADKGYAVYIVLFNTDNTLSTLKKRETTALPDDNLDSAVNVNWE